MSDESNELRRRQSSPDAMAGRQAAALVRDLNRQLGLWQASSVKLQTIAERLKATGHQNPAVAEELSTLFNVVQAEAERFEGMLPGHPPAVATHGRVKDTRRSFEMVAGRLRLSLQLLGVEPKVE